MKKGFLVTVFLYASAVPARDIVPRAGYPARIEAHMPFPPDGYPVYPPADTSARVIFRTDKAVTHSRI